jgi:hypothetical protein
MNLSTLKNLTNISIALLLWFSFLGATKHPIYLSVTHMEYNEKEKTIEISCKIFTNDLETTLKRNYKTNIDLLHPKNQHRMDSLLDNYLQGRLKIKVNKSNSRMEFVGYEQIEDAIFTYYQIPGIEEQPTLFEIDNTILYDYQKTQSSIIQVTVAGNRKSTKLVNPQRQANFEFK